MDDIPIFSGQNDELDSWLTCGQFLAMIEDHASKNDFTEDQLKELCMSKLSDNAFELCNKNLEQSWPTMKNVMFEKFPVKLSIRDKVEVRKKLVQQDSESIDNFYQRCIQAQYLVSDDIKDVGFEREVLLHFLIGLSPFIRDFVLATKCSSTIEYMEEAKKYTKIVKDVPIEPTIKIENEYHNDEFEAKNDEYDYELNLDYPSKLYEDDIDQYDDFCDVFDLKDEEQFEEKEIKKSKRLKLKCDQCNTKFSDNQTLKIHSQNEHNKCDKTFVDEQKHFKLWHSKKQCKKCDYTCKDQNLLKNHMKEMHNVRNKNASTRCQICKEDFETKALRLGMYESYSKGNPVMSFLNPTVSEDFIAHLWISIFKIHKGIGKGS